MSWIDILLIGGGVVLGLLLLAKKGPETILASQREVHSLPSFECRLPTSQTPLAAAIATRTSHEYAGNLCGVSTPSYVETINKPDSLGTCLTQNHSTSSHQCESPIVHTC